MRNQPIRCVINKQERVPACVSGTNQMKNVQSGFLAVLLAAVPQSILAQATPTSTIFNPAPSRIVGQAILQQQGLLTATALNLVEGRELAGPQGIAIDTSVSPPI